MPLEIVRGRQKDIDRILLLGVEGVGKSTNLAFAAATLRAAGRDDDAAVLLGQIAEYNRYDCRSTRQLRDWLLIQAYEAGVVPVSTQAVPGREPGEIETGDPLGTTLAGFIGDELGSRTTEQRAIALVSAARGFHQDRKSVV